MPEVYPLGMPELHWRELTDAANATKPVPNLLQSKVFKRRHPIAAEYVDIKLRIGKHILLPFVSDVAGGTIVQQSTKELGSVKIPRLRPKIQLDASALLGQPGDGQGVYVSSSADVKSAADNEIADTMADLLDRKDLTTEFMCAQALTGTLTARDKAVSILIDFRIPTANKPVLEGAARWGESGSDIKGNLRSWATNIRKALGSGPDLCFMGPGAAALFENDADIAAELNNRRIDVGKLKPDFDTELIGIYKGMEVWEYPFEYETKSGNKVSLMGDYAVSMVNSKANFTIEFGMIRDLKARANVKNENFVKVYEEEDPSALWMLLESRPLPIPWQPDALVFATVHDGAE